ncbi:hypothetical protein F2Q70_00043424 [Brassica cretica]|uniref:Uncharacterized protein n=1 Tax=Brassica cretica TaxID=69181 RepID=A0A8S9KL42_BRACR|nr:hypothetical protein F2Q70_00043424 [Brassica cretica]
MEHIMKIWVRTQRRSLMTISTLRKEIWKPRQRLASIDTANLTSIDPVYLISIDTHQMISIDTHCFMSCLDTRLRKNKLRIECRSLRPHTLLSMNIFDHIYVHEQLIVEIPIPPDRSVHLGSYNGVFADTMYAVASQRGTTTRSDKSGRKKRKNWKKRKRIKGDPQLSLILHFSNGVRKYRVRSRCVSQPFAKLRPLIIAEMIDKGEETVEAFTKK